MTNGLFRFWVFPDCTFLDISTASYFRVPYCFLLFSGVTPRKPARRLDFSPFRPPNTRKKSQTDLGAASSESPALRGFVGERGRFATTSLYLVLLSNRHISGSSPAVGVKGGANSADACPGCGDDATAPKAAGSGFRGVKLVRLRRGGIRTLGLCFALPKNPGPGVTGAYFPFYTCRRRSIWKCQEMCSREIPKI